MKLELRLTPSTDSVSFNHLHQLTGTLHKWLGHNNVHDGMSLYSFGWLRGGKAANGAIEFPNGAVWKIGFHDEQLVKRLMEGVLQDNQVFSGMHVREILEVSPPRFTSSFRFKTDGGAIVVRKPRADGTREYLLWDNAETDIALTRLLKHKLTTAGYHGTDLDVNVHFDRSYPKPRTKLTTIKTIKHKGSQCPVIIEGSKRALHFAWLVGIGELTGSGMGALQ